MKTRIFTLSGLAMLVLITACSPVKVVTDMDKSVDFSQYKTYSFLGWQKDSDQIMNEFDKKRIHEAFGNEFKARGMEYVEEGGDMAVSLFIVVDQKTSVTAYTDYYGSGGYGYRRYGGGWGYGSSTTTYSESDYLQGTLVLDAFDTKTKDQIWQAVATGTVTENPEKREKTIPRNVAAMMKEFPVPVVE